MYRCKLQSSLGFIFVFFCTHCFSQTDSLSITKNTDDYFMKDSLVDQSSKIVGLEHDQKTFGDSLQGKGDSTKVNRQKSMRFADKDQTQTFWGRVKYDGLSTFGGIKYAYSQPFHWKTKDFLTTGGIILGQTILYSIDTDSDRFFSEQGEDAPQFLKEFGWRFASPQVSFVVIGGIYTFGLLTKNEKWRKTGVLLISSAVSAGLIQTVSKTVVGRARPSTDKGKHFFKMFSNEGAYHSFPSGHSILSFTMAHAIAKQFDNFWIKAGIYTVGSIAPISRMWERAHWLTDVTFGMALSIIAVDSVDRYLNGSNRYQTTQKDKISWRLSAGVNTIGITASF